MSIERALTVLWPDDLETPGGAMHGYAAEFYRANWWEGWRLDAALEVGPYAAFCMEDSRASGARFYTPRVRICAVCIRSVWDHLPDPCLGELSGVKFACCGHGGANGYITFESGQTVYFGERCASLANWAPLA